MTRLILSIIMVATLASCMTWESDSHMNSSESSLENLHQFTQCAKRFELLELLEGLPRSADSNELSKGQFMDRTVVKLDQFWFYKEPLQIQTEQETKLRNLLSDTALYQPYSGIKRCGGFHPNFRVKLLNKHEEVIFYICFGCNELKASRGNESIHTDLSRDHSNKLRELLDSL